MRKARITITVDGEILDEVSLEAEFGPITQEEMDRQAQIDRDAAAMVRHRIANAS